MSTADRFRSRRGSVFWAACRASASALSWRGWPSGLKVAGWVKNTPDGVIIHAEGPADVLAVFGDRLRREPPPAAEIHDITRHEVALEGHAAFSIHESERADRRVRSSSAVITPDLAACRPCLAEFDSPDDRRFGFALSGCTDCGPRFSIQTSAPFDRERTTMLDFAALPGVRARIR